jgi:hypothetical protein
MGNWLSGYLERHMDNWLRAAYALRLHMLDQVMKG